MKNNLYRIEQKATSCSWIYNGPRNYEFAFFVEILLSFKAFKKLNEYRDLTKPPQNKVHTS